MSRMLDAYITVGYTKINEVNAESMRTIVKREQPKRSPETTAMRHYSDVTACPGHLRNSVIATSPS